MGEWEGGGRGDLRDRISSHEFHHIKAAGTIWFGEDHVNLLLEVCIESFEEILEEKRDQRSSELESFVSIVVFVVEEGWIQDCLQYSPHNMGDVDDLERR